MLTANIPLVYWVGYDEMRLISTQCAAKWAVVTQQDPLTRIFPRRWLDLKGQKIADFWQSALRAVMSTVVFRPGISQVGRDVIFEPHFSPHLLDRDSLETAGSVRQTGSQRRSSSSS